LEGAFFLGFGVYFFLGAGFSFFLGGLSNNFSICGNRVVNIGK
jgi:hypothetical protein